MAFILEMFQATQYRASQAKAKTAIKQWKTTFSQAWVPGGWDADLALRHRVENVPHAMLIGKDGKIAGMNFALGDEFGQRELIDAVRKTVGRK